MMYILSDNYSGYEDRRVTRVIIRVEHDPLTTFFEISLWKLIVMVGKGCIPHTDLFDDNIDNPGYYNNYRKEYCP